MTEHVGQRQRLAAILAADAAGYSRLMAVDEHATMAALDAARSTFREQVQGHDGRVIDTAGDSVLALFDTAVGAVGAALAIQAAIERQAAGTPSDRSLRFRIGVHLGDVTERGDGTVYGDGVNVAARLQALASPGGITVSDAVKGAVRRRVAAAFEDLGEQQVKNLSEPVRVYRVTPASDASARPAERGSPWRTPLWRRGLLAGGVGVAAALGVYAVALRLEGPSLQPAPPVLSVAVLPLRSAGAARDDAYAAGFTRDLTGMLAASLPDAPVVAPSVVSGLDAKAADPRRLGRELDVRYLVDGEVERDATQVAVRLALVDAATARHAWSRTVTVGLDKLREWPSLPVLRVSHALLGGLYEAEAARLAAAPVNKSDAKEIVLRAFLGPSETKEDLARFEALCDQALRRDPNLPDALNCKASVLFEAMELGLVPDFQRRAKEAGELSRRSIDLAPGKARSWHVRAQALFAQQQWEPALAAIGKAIELDPSRPAHVDQRAWLLLYFGHPEDALPLVERMADLAPSRAGARMEVACRAHLLLGRYGDAVTSCERAISENDHWTLQAWLAAAAAQQGDLAKAAAARAKAEAGQPALSVAWRRDYERQFSNQPRFWALYEAHEEPGLRAAGCRER